MTRAQYQYLRETKRRLEDAHKRAIVGLTESDWERETPKALEAQAVYEQLRSVSWRLEVAECRDMEFDEDHHPKEGT